MSKKVFLRLIVGSVVTFVVWIIILAIMKDEAPSFFPLNNPQAEYRVSKKCPGGQGWTEQTPTQQDNGYCIEYKGPEVFMNDKQGETGFFRVTVGLANLELEPLIGKKVKNIKGKYVTSNFQCINKVCLDFGGPYAVLNVDSLELAE